MLPCQIRRYKAAWLAQQIDPEQARVERGCLEWCRRKHEADRAARGYHVTLDQWPPKVRRPRARWERE